MEQGISVHEREKNVEIMKRLSLVIVICLAVLTSCDNVDFSQLETDRPYTGLYQGKDCVVLIDQAEEGNLKGRVYLDDGSTVISPIAFTSNLKKDGKGELFIKNQEKILNKVRVDEGKVEGNLDETPFSLSLCQETDFPFKAQYMEPCYDIVVEQGRIYAKNVEGYWSSYPDTGESFGKIYLKRSPSLVIKKGLNLDMDLYYPKEPIQEERRPLLILIHGGAFFNGDKQDLGFPELGRHFAERGYVVASINYRLGFMLLGADADRAGYRALQDAHAAVCYLMENADEFGIDTTKIFAAGTSAGAITALNLAFMREEKRPEITKKGGIIGETSTVFSRCFHVLQGGVQLFHIGKGMSELQVFSKLGLDTDLGPINVVSDSLSRPFRIKAVVNMWGAVHALDILTDSQTDILSFHGDADRIVPYSYGYPFNQVLEPYVDSVLTSFPKLLQPVANMGRYVLKNGRPFNEWAFNPLYGSSQIHDKATSLGLHSELVMVEDRGHSLHLDDDNTLSVFFNDTIVPRMTQFLYEETVEGKQVRLQHSGSWIEALDIDNVAEIHWQVEGGAVVDKQGSNKVKVLLFSDAPHHCIMAGGKYKNGTEFKVSVPLGGGI